MAEDPDTDKCEFASVSVFLSSVSQIRTQSQNVELSAYSGAPCVGIYGLKVKHSVVWPIALPCKMGEDGMRYAPLFGRVGV